MAGAKQAAEKRAGIRLQAWEALHEAVQGIKETS